MRSRVHPVEKQEQDIEGESQATKDHTADQETIAALSLKYSKGKTQRYRLSKPHMKMYWRKRPLLPVAGFSVKFRPATPIDRNTGRRDISALFPRYVSGGSRNPAVQQRLDPLTLQSLSALCPGPFGKFPSLP